MKLPLSIQENLFKVDPKKPKPGLCAVRFCRKTKAKKDSLCPCCRKRRQKITDPVRYTFNALKNNAKRRGKEFSISLEYFKGFCIETGYIESKGRRFDSMTIDRIDSRRGYVEGNIRVLSNSANASKGNNDNNDLPF
jgi:hypothetical protein